MLVSAALAATVGACGSSEEGSSGRDGEPAGTGAGRPARAEAETQARTEAGAEKSTAVETVPVAYGETAAEQTAKTTFEMTMTTPPAGPEGSGQPAPTKMTMVGEGATDFSGEASVLSLQMAGMGTMEMRQVGDVVYTKMPEEFAAQVSGGKPWLKMSLDEVYGQSGAGQMQGGAASDPTRQLEYLRGVSDSVEKAGQEGVRGVQTTRYKATISVEELVSDLDGGAREEYEKAMRQTGMEKMPVEVWLDDQNRARRYALDMRMDIPEDASDAPEGAPPGGMRMQMVAEYYDFGTAANVQAPPPDQTADGSKMFPAQQTAARWPRFPSLLTARDALT